MIHSTESYKFLMTSSWLMTLETESLYVGPDCSVLYDVPQHSVGLYPALGHVGISGSAHELFRA